ncbi:MAG: BON domain-containing protein [Betaproteobacteria bacterium]|nr:BON domain-containing protein [Betaproteobacteria bacterium]
MKNPHRYLLSVAQGIAAILLLATLPGCFPLVATGMGAAVLMADDRRTTGAIVDDEGIENKALLRVQQKHSNNVHLNVTSFNRVVLLTGEVPSAEIRADIERIVRGVDNVRTVQNELAVNATTTMMLRGNDSVQTSKVKARFLDVNKFRANHVKVVTENGVVYLMGIVKRQEAQDATEIARTTSGVQRVVRVFEYMD